ncbi:MAG: hypothetical protein ABIQ24_11910 [Nitrospiraceae bacterium]
MKVHAGFVLAALGLVLIVSGCHQIGSGVAPSNIPLAPGGYEIIGPVNGKSCIDYLLGIFPLGELNSMQAAMTDALAKHPEATALVQVTADTSRMWFIIITEDCTRVQGTAVKGK